jgi:hypothetical protein
MAQTLNVEMGMKSGSGITWTLTLTGKPSLLLSAFDLGITKIRFLRTTVFLIRVVKTLSRV